MLVRFAIEPDALFEDNDFRQEKVNRLLEVWRQYGVLVTMDTSAWKALPTKAKISITQWEDIKKILHLDPPQGYPSDRSARKRSFADIVSPDKARDLIGKLDLILLDPVRAQEIGLHDPEPCYHVESMHNDANSIEIISRWDNIDQCCRISDAKVLHNTSISLPDKPQHIWNERFESLCAHSGSTFSVIDPYIARDSQSNRSALLNFLSFLSECSGNRCEFNIFSTLKADTNVSAWENKLRSAITNLNLPVKKFKEVNFYIYPDTVFQHDRRVILSNRVLEIGPGLPIFAYNQGKDEPSFSVKPMCGKKLADCTGCEVHKFARIIDQLKADCPKDRFFTFPVFLP